MSFLQVKRDAVKKESSGGGISTSGIYSLNLKQGEIAPTSGGATQANYYFDKVISYSNIIIDKAGKPTFGMDILSALAAVLGEDALSNPEQTPVKFKNSTKNLECIPELEDVNVKVWLQFDYHIWKGEIKEKIVVKRFYRDSDGASGSEAMDLAEGVEGIVAGTQLEKDKAYSTEVKYEGVTEAEVKAWKIAQAEAAKGGAKTPAPQANAGAAASAFPSRG